MNRCVQAERRTDPVVQIVRGKLFVSANIVLPLLTGAAIYVLFAPDVRFVRALAAMTGGADGLLAGTALQCSSLMRWYLPDMLWAYALVCALFFLIGNNTASLLCSFVISAGFSSAAELLQLTALMPGTFDPADLLVELLAELIAVFIMKLTIRRSKE